MHFDERGHFVRTDMWREGDYLDLWSVVHFLSGITLCFVILLLDFGQNASFLLALLLLIGYEMFEVIAKIEETRWNRVLDVLVGMSSFTPAYFLLPLISGTAKIYLLGGVITLNIVLATFGWMASRKAAVLEKNLRHEFEMQREKFEERRKRRKAKRARRREMARRGGME